MNERKSGATLLLASAILFSGCAGSPEMNGSAGEPGNDSASRKMASTADLADKRIGVVLGSVYDTFATKTWPNATVLHYESGNDLALAVTAGKVDAGLSDLEPLTERFRTNDELAILGEPLLSLPIGAGFRKENAALREEFNRFLAQIEEDGTLADMVDRWMNQHATEMPVVAAVNPRGSLAVGTTVGALPYAAVVDGKRVGFDIELVERFAAHLGREATYSEMPFGGLIAAAASGKVQMIIASIFITEERKLRIDFSDPYHETAGVAYILKSNLAGSAAGAPQPTPASFLAKVASSWNDNIVKERRYLLLLDGLEGHRDHRRRGHPLRHRAGRAGVLHAHVAVGAAQRAGEDLHRDPARHTGRGAADADLLRGLRVGRHQRDAGRRHRLRHELRGLRVGDVPRRHPERGQGAVRGGHRHGLHQAADVRLHHPAADDPARPAGLQGRVHLAGQDDLDRRLHRRAGPDQGRRHHPQPDLRRVLSADPGRGAVLPDLLGADAGPRVPGTK